MVLQIGNLIIFNTYILPESTTWHDKIEDNPNDSLAAAIATAYSTNSPILMLGNFNVRTTSLQPYVLNPARKSRDSKSSPRGNWLLRTFFQYDMILLNGISKFGPQSGKYTSFQGVRRSVIDYGAASKSLLNVISAFTICPRMDKYDHSALIVSLNIKFQELDINPQPKKRQKKDKALPNVTYLDKLLIKTIEAGHKYNHLEQNRRTFGLVHVETNTIQVGIQGVCTRPGTPASAAAAGVFFGPNSPQNHGS